MKPEPVLLTQEPDAALGAKKKRFSLDNRFLAPLLITCILVIGHLYYGIVEVYSSPLLTQLTFGFVRSYSPTFVAIVTAVLMELALGRMVTMRWPHLASAYISGISVGILIRSPELWPYVLCALIAITSKYAVRVEGRHLWNPSNLGISVMLFLAPATVAPLTFQWSNQIWPVLIIWCLGSAILYRLGRLHISTTYVAAFVPLAFVRSVVTGHPWLTEVAPITGPVYQLFIFFMITDPKTTTQTKARRCAVAIAVAIVETVFRLCGDSGVQDQAALWFGQGMSAHYGLLGELAVHAPYYALFIVGPTANLIEIIWTRKRGTTSLASTPANGPGL
jgi:Na+-translocating ferredoxin:NAD+ oxidoreductase RnfD subunit